MKRLVLLVFTSFALISTVVRAGDVITSPRDDRQYKVIELENSLKVALVSDVQLQQAAAALSVNVGSNANPRGREGLAHFLEHMLFLGTEKFPEVGEYQSFISANGGNHNAFTAYDNTTYFFDVKSDALEPALDRFAQFFISPLFTPEYVERERNAVHSEFESKRLDDGRRNYVADKLLMNPEHAWSMFSVGNLDTLSNTDDKPIRPDLFDFYQRYYSANLMTAALIGPQSIEQLEDIARQYFAPIENRNVLPYRDSVALYDETRLPQQMNVKTIKSMQELNISFPLPERRSYWQTKPLYYIANQLGYEGEGSLLSYLKERGWAKSLGAWIGIDLEQQSRFDITIELTDLGQQHEADVIEAVFAKLELMRTSGLKAELYDEQRALAEVDFLFQQSGDPSHTVTRFARMLAEYPAEEMLRAPYRFDEYRPTEITAFLERMVPERMILTRYSDDIETDSRESFYGIEYAIDEISDALVDRWSNPPTIAQLSIKSLNPFVAQRFDLKSGEQRSTPVRLVQTEKLELWHLLDTSFEQPRGAINLALFTPAAMHSAESAVASTLLTRMLTELETELLYDASLAGLSAQLYPHMRGISIKVNGYDDRLPELFDTQLQALNLPLDNEALFDRILQDYREELENSLKDKPYNRAFSELYNHLMPGWSAEERLAALGGVDLETLKNQREQLLEQGQIRLLVHGNLSLEDAQRVGARVEQAFKEMKPLAIPQLSVRQLGETSTLMTEVDHSDRALVLYLQSESETLRQRTEVALLNEMLSAPFYTSLRTEQQLGYIVFSNFMPMNEQPGIAFVTQSPVASVEDLKNAYIEFLNDWREQLPALLDAQLQEYKASLASRISTPSQRLSDETARLWREIDRDNPAFDTREQMLSAIDEISAVDLIGRMDQLMQRQLWVASAN